jgi:hypothetical protein
MMYSKAQCKAGIFDQNIWSSLLLHPNLGRVDLTCLIGVDFVSGLFTGVRGLIVADLRAVAYSAVAYSVFFNVIWGSASSTLLINPKS